jgi:hypothetical protein
VHGPLHGHTPYNFHNFLTKEPPDSDRRSLCIPFLIVESNVDHNTLGDPIVPAEKK